MAKKFSERKFELKAKEILARMRAEAKPFPDDSPAAKKKRLDRGKEDLPWFFKTYFPHYFNKPFGEFQKEWVQLVDIPDEPVFIAAPRGHTKSTFFTLGVPVHDICFKLRYFIIIVSDTEDLAGDFTTFLQLELEGNERLKQDFGDQFNAGDWEQNDFTTKNGIRVMARGRGQRIRGLRNREHRVDRIIIDDLENDKNVKNPRLVKDTIDWLLQAVMNTLGEGGSMTMVGTLLSKKSVLASMINMKAEDNPQQLRYISRTYRALSEEGEPLWPGGWSKERLLKKKFTSGTVNFNKEYQNDPKDDDGLFRDEWIRYYHPEELKGRELRIATFIDPSSESGASNDYKAIITLGQDKEGIYYVLDAFIRRCSPDMMVRATYSRYEEFKPIRLSMEENALGEFAAAPFKLAAIDKGYRLPIKGMKHSTAKESRVGRLSVFVERGILRFQKGHSDQGLLVEQLVYFPSTTVNDDGPDALEGAVDLLEGSAFSPGFEVMGA
jgi:predicted phage terminase large subunit-like protein